MFAYWLQGAALGLSAAATPGPSQAFIIAQSLKQGWRRTLPAVLSPLISDGPIIALVLLVLTQLPPGFVRVIQVAGGLFVLYLAWKSFRAWQCFQPQAPDPGASGKTLLQAVLMNFLSPGPYLFWSLMAGPTLVRGWNETPARGMAFVFGFYLAMLGGMTALVVIFGAARQIGPKVNRALLGLSALALAGFGLYQLWSGFTMS